MNNAYHQAIPQSTEAYRQSTKAQLWLSHVQKRCSCNKVITSKQLAQYGKCAACYKAGRSATDTKNAGSSLDGSALRQLEAA